MWSAQQSYVAHSVAAIPRTSAGSTNDHLEQPADDVEADEAAAPEPEIVEWSGAHPYFAANPLSGGADTHNNKIIVSLDVPIDRESTAPVRVVVADVSRPPRAGRSVARLRGPGH